MLVFVYDLLRTISIARAAMGEGRQMSFQSQSLPLQPHPSLPGTHLDVDQGKKLQKKKEHPAGSGIVWSVTGV